MSKEEARIPIWQVSLLATVAGAVLAGAVCWGQARADVANLKEEVRAIKPLESAVSNLNQAVAVLNTKIPAMNEKVDRIETSQIEMQKGINTLLMRRER